MTTVPMPRCAASFPAGPFGSPRSRSRSAAFVTLALSEELQIRDFTTRCHSCALHVVNGTYYYYRICCFLSNTIQARFFSRLVVWFQRLTRCQCMITFSFPDVSLVKYHSCHVNKSQLQATRINIVFQHTSVRATLSESISIINPASDKSTPASNTSGLAKLQSTRSKSQHRAAF